MRVGGLIVIAGVMLACKPGGNEVGSEISEVGRAITRPIEDFLLAQGTQCVVRIPGGTRCALPGEEDCYLFVPPDRNFLGWTNDTDTNNDGVPDEPLLFAGFDYAGLADAYAPGNLPEITGTIKEQRLSDGRARVKIQLHTRGANAWVMGLDLTTADEILDQIANRPTLFGHRPRDVQAGAAQALADTTLNVTLINTAPGAPLPDLVQFNFEECVPDGVEQERLHFVARARGPLTAEFGVPENTPGQCTINQNGVFQRHVDAGNGDDFPAEFIKLKVVGR